MRNVIYGANVYNNRITELSDEVMEEMWREARAYNSDVNGNTVPDPFIPGSGRILPENYRTVLDMGEGIMGYVDIPKIRVYLPIYHGVAEHILEKGAGHIEQTALPIGGSDNLSIITAHTGFVGATMFDKLVDLVKGDIFRIHVLNEILTYEVDDIRVILPEEIGDLIPVQGEDYVTLVTCTPYGINTHRLLVRGSRIENIEVTEEIQEVPFPVEVLWMIMLLFFMFSMPLIFSSWQVKRNGNRKKHRKQTKRRKRMRRIKQRRERRKREKWRGGVLTLLLVLFILSMIGKPAQAHTVAYTGWHDFIRVEINGSISNPVIRITLLQNVQGNDFVGTADVVRGFEAQGGRIGAVMEKPGDYVEITPRTLTIAGGTDQFAVRFYSPIQFGFAFNTASGSVTRNSGHYTIALSWEANGSDWQRLRMWPHGWGNQTVSGVELNLGANNRSMTWRYYGAIDRYFAPILRSSHPLSAWTSGMHNGTENLGRGISVQRSEHSDELLNAAPNITVQNQSALQGVVTGSAFSNGYMIPNRIGVATATLRYRDEHSRDTTITRYIPDTTYLDVERKVIVAFNMPVPVNITYASGALNTAGGAIASNTVYSESGTNPCGGEEGWTNQPLFIEGNLLATGGISATSSANPQGRGRYTTRLLGSGGTNIALNTGINSNHVPVRVPTYHTETPVAGVTFTAQLEETGNPSQVLSGISNTPVSRKNIKIDRTPPIIDSVTSAGGVRFIVNARDTLSGLSTTRLPQIAFTAANGGNTLPTNAVWHDLNTVNNVEQGKYDIWVRVTDKASNVTTSRVHTNFAIEGVLELEKTSSGATTHISTCSNQNSLVRETSCNTACVTGSNATLRGGEAFTYTLTLRNRTVQTELGDMSGTFEDVLPRGVIVTTAPNVSHSAGVANVSNLTYAQRSDGRYVVSGNYTNFKRNAAINITISCTAPEFDMGNTGNNILRNQLTSTWSVGNTSSSTATRNTLSNHVVHGVVVSGVTTAFTKVSADNRNTGLANAQFALFRWNGANAPTQAQRNHIVDTTQAVNIVQGGEWVRVKKDGETTTSTSEVFTSSSSPAGLVELGELEKGVYTLIETKAAAGYELPVGQWILTIDPEKTDTVGNYRIDFVGKSAGSMPPAVIRETTGNAHIYKVLNARPLTVGMSGLGGTREILLLGAVMMGIAGATFVVYTCKQQKKTK